eukprot:422861-Pyramimonas_sp.AAC.1
MLHEFDFARALLIDSVNTQCMRNVTETQLYLCIRIQSACSTTHTRTPIVALTPWLVFDGSSHRDVQQPQVPRVGTFRPILPSLASALCLSLVPAANSTAREANSTAREANSTAKTANSAVRAASARPSTKLVTLLTSHHHSTHAQDDEIVVSMWCKAPPCQRNELLNHLRYNVHPMNPAFGDYVKTKTSRSRARSVTPLRRVRALRGDSKGRGRVGGGAMLGADGGGPPPDPS